MIVNIKKTHKNAVIPAYAKDGDAGMDLTVVDFEILDSKNVKYDFGLAFEIPKGYVGFIFPRSSCYKQNQMLSNSVGVIDSGYRGNVSAVMTGKGKECRYAIGERAAQIIIMPYPSIKFNEVQEISETERGSTGYGSTGKK
jgi:dUTP pyrophosphatase